MLKTPQVLGKTDISVESLGDPLRPPDHAAVFLDQSVNPSINLQQQFSKEANSSSPNHMSQQESSSASTPYTSSTSPVKRKRRGENGGRHSLMHRCAQDFWVPLTSVTSHSVENTHKSKYLHCSHIFYNILLYNFY